ncbi:MAG: FtsX-like permease family protein [Fimbriimonadales bacterium]
MVRNPLSPGLYLRRNAGKTVPLIAVIVLAVLLVAGIISLINSIPLSIRTIYKYSARMLGVGPRGDASLTPKIVKVLNENSPVELDRVLLCRATPAQVRSIVGKWPFAVIGVKKADMPYYLRRMDATLVQGRLPNRGAGEAVVTEPVARNLNLKIGSALLKPDDNENYSPQPVRVVGIAKSDQWLMAVDYDYVRDYHFPPIDIALAFAKNLNEQDRLDRWAAEVFAGHRAQIFAYFQVEKQTNEMFVTLYKILNVVIGTLVLVITVMMGMLINIYQSQRLVEFGLLQALGYTKKQLLRRVLVETSTVIVLGWSIGVFLAFLGLKLVKYQLMDPNAYALDVTDPVAFLYTAAVPIAILVVAFATVARRFQAYDPVGIVERRLV